MADEGDEDAELAPITFRFEYRRHGWAEASISDGETTYEMVPSCVPNDPLFDLVRALVEVLRYGGQAQCDWSYEPAADRWILHRDGVTLTITIPGVRDGFTRVNWPTERGELKFSTTCDLWKFAAKVRLAVSRLEPPPAGEADHRHPEWVKESAEYRALCTFLEERKTRRKELPGKRRS
jgi:hypothetical protein